MKKIKFFFFGLLVFFVSGNIVNALCTSEEINNLRKIANNVNISYEVVQEEAEKGTYDPPDSFEDDYILYKNYFNVYITNITEDIYVVVKNNYDNKSTTYTYKDTDNGSLTIRDDDIYHLKKYIVEVYAENRECSEILRTVDKQLPKYNDYSSYAFCTRVPDYYLCREYIEFDIDYPFEEIARLASEYYEKKNKEDISDDKTIIEKIPNNKILIIIGVGIIVVLGVGLSLVIVKKRRK